MDTEISPEPLQGVYGAYTIFRIILDYLLAFIVWTLTLMIQKKKKVVADTVGILVQIRVESFILVNICLFIVICLKKKRVHFTLKCS